MAITAFQGSHGENSDAWQPTRIYNYRGTSTLPPTYFHSSMLFWPSILHSCCHPSWPSPVFLFLLLTKHIRPCPCEAAAGHMRLSSQGHAWWFPHKIQGRWPHMVSSYLTKDQDGHALSAVGEKRWLRLAGSVECRVAGILGCRMARVTAPGTELGWLELPEALWFCIILLGLSGMWQLWGFPGHCVFVLCCWGFLEYRAEMGKQVVGVSWRQFLTLLKLGAEGD